MSELRTALRSIQLGIMVLLIIGTIFALSIIYSIDKVCT